MSHVEPDARTREARAAHLKERIYITFAALAVVLALRAHGHVEPWDALATLAVTVTGALFAVFTADVLAHLVVHARMLDRHELRQVCASTFGAFGVIVVPVIVLVLSGIGVVEVDTALVVSIAVLLLSLVFIGFLAVRRIRMAWWQRLVVLAAEAALGLVVIGLQVLAHG
ncbi:hypothetical protein [Microbacterium sp. NPDC055683]